LQYQIDNLKISKEQQTLASSEKLTEADEELARLKKVIQEKDIAL